ncbi:hypothetical protein [Rhodococcus baikonurensis]|uniref:DUF222 domain-containing protein n=1 Tax=Rhodococcus baikonurensis TaxID=172041 RepID=A0ABV5X8R9_9NOCA
MGTNEVSTDEVITELTKIYGDTFDRTVRHTSLNPRREGIIAVLVHLQSTRRLMADEVADIITVANAALQYGDSTLGEAAHRILSQFPITGTVNPTTEPDDTDTEQRSEPESFEFLNELALAFRAAENHPRPQYAPVLEGVRAVLAHLTAAGRLVPAGGMALTAEEVEKVRAAREELRGYRNFTGYGRSHVNQLIAAVDALFPATEPALYCSKGVCSANEGHDGTCAEASGWAHDAYEDPPTPAEPAEEETKADPRMDEADLALAETRAEVACAVAKYPPFNSSHEGYAVLKEEVDELWDDVKANNVEHSIEEAVQVAAMAIRYITDMRAASSPVVPAPNETGPWQTWQEVPEGVKYESGAKHWGAARKYLNRSGVRMAVVNGEEYPSTTDESKIQGLAPFVAAEEG